MRGSHCHRRGFVYAFATPLNAKKMAVEGLTVSGGGLKTPCSLTGYGLGYPY